MFPSLRVIAKALFCSGGLLVAPKPRAKADDRRKPILIFPELMLNLPEVTTFVSSVPVVRAIPIKSKSHACCCTHSCHPEPAKTAKDPAYSGGANELTINPTTTSDLAHACV